MIFGQVGELIGGPIEIVCGRGLRKIKTEREFYFTHSWLIVRLVGCFLFSSPCGCSGAIHPQPLMGNVWGIIF
jgi:hypothetical protein